jgi:RimJ/RimL family protein N-acetyltransferase
MTRLPFSRPSFLRGPRIDTPLQRPELTTQRLTLRPYRLTDAADWFAIQSVAEINHYMKWPVRDASSSLAHLRDRTSHTGLSQTDDFLALAVELDGHVIGDVSLRLKSVLPETRNVEVAWMLHPAHGGRGYATEATAALLDLAYDELGARWATALIDLTNVRSIAVAERLGLRGIPLDGDTVAFVGSPAVREAHTDRRGTQRGYARHVDRRAS